MIGRLDESLDEAQRLVGALVVRLGGRHALPPRQGAAGGYGAHHGTKQARLAPTSIVPRYRWRTGRQDARTCATAVLLLDSVFQVRTIVIPVHIVG
jgi:hypothetical protein